MLQSLPIDLTDEQRKSQMKKSQLGHVVMFLSKPEVEDNRANRRIARVNPSSQATQPLVHQHMQQAGMEYAQGDRWT